MCCVNNHNQKQHQQQSRKIKKKIGKKKSNNFPFRQTRGFFLSNIFVISLQIFSPHFRVVNFNVNVYSSPTCFIIREVCDCFFSISYVRWFVRFVEKIMHLATAAVAVLLNSKKTFPCVSHRLMCRMVSLFLE